MVLRRFPQQILNHCIDDIEQLVLRIKASAEAWKKLQKKRRVKAGGRPKLQKTMQIWKLILFQFEK